MKDLIECYYFAHGSQPDAKPTTDALTVAMELSWLHLVWKLQLKVEELK